MDNFCHFLKFVLETFTILTLLNFLTVLILPKILDNFDNDDDNPGDLWPLRH